MFNPPQRGSIFGPFKRPIMIGAPIATAACLAFIANKDPLLNTNHTQAATKDSQPKVERAEQTNWHAAKPPENFYSANSATNHSMPVRSLEWAKKAGVNSIAREVGKDPNMVITQKDIAWAQDPENFGADCAWGIGANPTLKITPELLDWALKPENFRASFASGLGFNPTLEITPALLARLQAKENNDSSLATAAMIAMPTTPSLIEWCQQNENKNSNLAGIIGGRLWMLDSTVSLLSPQLLDWAKKDNSDFAAQVLLSHKKHTDILSKVQ